MLIEGKSITFNGGGHKLDGQGSYYWDGKGGNGGVTFRCSPLHAFR